MKIVSTIARYLLGLMFTVFGLNGFLHFIPQPPISGLTLQFFTVLSASHFFLMIFAVQLICGILLLINRWTPLALVALAAVLVNIYTFHILLSPGTIAPAILALILWVLVAIPQREKLMVLFS